MTDRLRNRMVEGVEVAPAGCIVCHKPKPDTANEPGWTYLANSVPVGTITCSERCLKTAIKRWKRCGRTDTPAMRALEVQ
jgi:predicted nucleic acid-binding Zn ribbon protein